MVNCDGWADCKRKGALQAKTGIGGLTLSDDPFMKDNDHRFSDDMTLWPRIEYGHIFGYFINRPGTYTQKQLLSWKQLEAYNYFESGFVRTVFAMGFGQGDQKCCLLKAKVNPSQRTADQAHEAWIIARSSGLVVSAHCTCMAG